MTLPKSEESEDQQSGSVDRNVRSVHDMQASLAILNGYGESLNSSFTELCDHIDVMVAKTALQDDLDAVGQLKTLEADCRFCLSRIRSSAGLLKERLDSLKIGGL